MKKFAYVIAGAALAISLSACGGSSDPQVTVTETSGIQSTPDFDQPTDTTLDDEFISTVKENTALEGTDKEFTDLADSVCVAFDEGSSFEDVISIMTANDISDYDSGFFVGASVGAYCPEHADLFQ